MLRGAAGHFFAVSFWSWGKNKKPFPSRQLENEEIWENRMHFRKTQTFSKNFIGNFSCQVNFCFLLCCGVLSKDCVKMGQVPVCCKGQLSYLAL